MPARSHRHDPYGRPLPSLVPAAPDVLAECPVNVLQRQRLVTMLHKQLDVLLRRDMTAEVTLAFKVIEGVIQGNSLSLSVGRRFRAEEDF